MILKRIILLFVFAFGISFLYTYITNTQLPWYSAIALGILGYYLSEAVFPKNKKEE
jgi:hypothetical protein